MRWRLAILVVLTILTMALALFAAMIDTARAATLPAPAAERAIRTYERTYWQGRHTDVTLGHCQRHSPTQVSCVVHIQRGTRTLTIRDWATLLEHAIRVHPGSTFDEVRQLS